MSVSCDSCGLQEDLCKLVDVINYHK